MKNLNKIALGALVLTVLAVFGTQYVSANPFYFSRSTATATATTTLAFMTPGTATTTLQHDSYVEGNNTKTDSASLMIMLQASSTATVLATNIEYSENGIDWYQNNLSISTAPNAAVAMATPASYTWTFATSTIGGLLNGGAGVDFGAKVIIIPTPYRYIRAVFSLTGANGGVYAKFMPAKERSEQ